jgi:hypothetical protein
MKENMKRLGWERSIRASSLRGLQGRSATNQNGQAAKEKKEKISCGLDAAKTVLASGSGRSVFRLTSPYIGLPGCLKITGPNLFGPHFSVSLSNQTVWPVIFGLTGPICARALKSLHLLGLRLRGHHD